MDQLVNIEYRNISVYKNGELDFKPAIGHGLNKEAILHIYNCFPEEGKNMNEEQLSIHLCSLQKICKDKRVFTINILFI